MSTHYFTPDTTNEVADGNITCDRCGGTIPDGKEYIEVSQKVGIFSGNHMLDHDYEVRSLHLLCHEGEVEEAREEARAEEDFTAEEEVSREDREYYEDLYYDEY
jgi:hypothetical protein